MSIARTTKQITFFKRGGVVEAEEEVIEMQRKDVTITIRKNGDAYAAPTNGIVPERSSKDGGSLYRGGRVESYSGDPTKGFWPRIRFSFKPMRWLLDAADRRYWSVDDYETDEETKMRPLDSCDFDLTDEECNELAAFFVCKPPAKSKPIVVTKQEGQDDKPMSCHYCGKPAYSFDFFDVPVCPGCGGKEKWAKS